MGGVTRLAVGQHAARTATKILTGQFYPTRGGRKEGKWSLHTCASLHPEGWDMTGLLTCLSCAFFASTAARPVADVVLYLTGLRDSAAIGAGKHHQLLRTSYEPSVASPARRA